MQTYDSSRIGALAAPELKPFHCQNKACKCVLAYTDGERLVFGDVEISNKRQFLYHRACGHTSVWRRIGETDR